MAQGVHTTLKTVQRIINQLRFTDLPHSKIARPLSISPQTVTTINNQEKVRDYRGRHKSWFVDRGKGMEEVISEEI